MAMITGFNVTINVMCNTDAADKSCFLAYTYNVLWDENEPQDEEYTVTAHLWGGSSFDHSPILFDPKYDSHKISRGTTMPNIRKITVPCNRLDNFWGDNIIVKLVMIPDSDPKLRYEALSSTEMEEQVATPEMEEHKHVEAAA